MAGSTRSNGLTDSLVTTQREGAIFIVCINRPSARNAVDAPTAAALLNAFNEFDADESLSVAVLTGNGGVFCAGADLKAMADDTRRNVVEPTGTAHGPMGPTRLALSKPVIAAVSGHAVAGGLELALWCDLRVADTTACRRWGVPLIDGGTVRLPRIVGQSRAMDMILTGRPVMADEALQIGLANRVVPEGQARAAACELAEQISQFPQQCLRADRTSALEQWSLPLSDALAAEGAGGYPVISVEAIEGAARFSQGAGRHGAFND